jgi:hypothetical protein
VSTSALRRHSTFATNLDPLTRKPIEKENTARRAEQRPIESDKGTLAPKLTITLLSAQGPANVSTALGFDVQRKRHEVLPPRAFRKVLAGEKN